MTTIQFPGHHLAHCTTPDCRGCMLCHGGLGLCTACGGMEGSLPTDCPGEPMPELVEQEVYAARLDYRRDRGWIQEPSDTWSCSPRKAR